MCITNFIFYFILDFIHRIWRHY